MSVAFTTFAHKGKKSKILKETYNFKIDLWRIPSLGQLAVPTAIILCNMKILGPIYSPENRYQIMSNMGISGYVPDLGFQIMSLYAVPQLRTNSGRARQQTQQT